jgi:uncharacterized SAM-binding protein YcdF (DUF218 family)
MIDLIVALGGGDDRKQEALTLYKQSVGSHILFTGEPNLSQMYYKWGVGPEGIYTTFISTDTPTDVTQVRDAMVQNGFKSVLIVDSNYHLRRTKMLFGRTFCVSDSVTYQGVPSPTTWKIILNESFAYIKEFITVLPKC